MKKILFLLSITFICIATTAQDYESFTITTSNDCGTLKYVKDSTEWITIDTLRKYINPAILKDVIEHRYDSDWVYSYEKQITETIVLAIHAPCKPLLSYSEQYRICKITGIRQKIIRSEGYIYIPNPLSEYDSTVLKFKSK